MAGEGRRRAVEELDVEECWRLLRTRTVGRLAVNRPVHGPLVVPVVYAVDGAGGLVFRTDAGTKLARISRGTVGFQVDHVDEDARTGWSVLVSGLAHRLDADDPAVAAVDPWLPGALAHAVRVVPTSVTGRRLP